jgi:hypothetical protein
VVGEFCHVRRVVEGPARPAPRMPRLAADRCGLDRVYSERRATAFSGTGGAHCSDRPPCKVMSAAAPSHGRGERSGLYGAQRRHDRSIVGFFPLVNENENGRLERFRYTRLIEELIRIHVIKERSCYDSS